MSYACGMDIAHTRCPVVPTHRPDIQEAPDVDRRSYLDWGFRCRLRPPRLDIGETEARHEKSSWRLSISGRHDARRAARVSDCLGLQLILRRNVTGGSQGQAAEPAFALFATSFARDHDALSLTR
jgi:hypothetical protein